jgi:hypothetical protein
MRIKAFHSRLGMFYHDNDDCPFARTIKPASRRDGESGLGTVHAVPQPRQGRRRGQRQPLAAGAVAGPG